MLWVQGSPFTSLPYIRNKTIKAQQDGTSTHQLEWGIHIQDQGSRQVRRGWRDLTTKALGEKGPPHTSRKLSI